MLQNPAACDVHVEYVSEMGSSMFVVDHLRLILSAAQSVFLIVVPGSVSVNLVDDLIS